MGFAKYGFTLAGLLLLTSGCAASETEPDDSMAGAGQLSFGNAGQAAPMAGASAPRMDGSAGSSALPAPQASAGRGSPAASGGPPAAGTSAGSAGMSGSAGTDAEWPAWPTDEEMPPPPPDPAMCADAFCFDIFDCYIFNLDKIDCGFTDCVDFVCK